MVTAWQSRRARWTTRAELTAAALLLLAGSAVGVGGTAALTAQIRQHDSLVEHGAHATGTVLSLTPGRNRFDGYTLVVGWTADHPVQKSFTVSRPLQPGTAVDVTYTPGHPSEAVIPLSGDDASSVVVLVLAVVTGLGLLTGGAVRLRRWLRARAVLTRYPWVTVAVTARRVFPLVRAVDAGAGPLVLPLAARGPRTAEVLWCGPLDGPAVLMPAGGGAVTPAVPSRLARRSAR